MSEIDFSGPYPVEMSTYAPPPCKREDCRDALATAIARAEAAERERDYLADIALTALAGAGIATPEKGYKGDMAGWLGHDITGLRYERDALRARLERLEAAGKGMADSISTWTCIACDVEEFGDADPNDCCDECGPVASALAALRKALEETPDATPTYPFELEVFCQGDEPAGFFTKGHHDGLRLAVESMRYSVREWGNDWRDAAEWLDKTPHHAWWREEPILNEHDECFGESKFVTVEPHTDGAYPVTFLKEWE